MLKFRTTIVEGVALFLIGASPLVGQVSQVPTNPMAIGMQALAHEQWADAESFFTSYLRQNPESVEGQFYLGFAFFGEKQYDKAEKVYLKLVAANAKNWSVHSSLAEVYAADGRWPDFDRERKLVRDARAHGESGVSRDGNDVIDVLYVADERYIVREYNPLAGRYHTRYNFTHFNEHGNLDFWIACESDDIDQSSFAAKHPKEAAAGQRSFSLDSYSQARNAGGQLTGQTHGTLRFYPDGEPTYEEVRTDVLRVLDGKHKPVSTSTVPAQPAIPQLPAKP